MSSPTAAAAVRREDIDEKTASRFRAKVRIDPNGCWLWTGARNGKGGFAWWRGKARMARRLALLILGDVDEIPAGKIVWHAVCRNLLCMRPDHLAVGVQGDQHRAHIRGAPEGGLMAALPPPDRVQREIAFARRVLDDLGARYETSYEACFEPRRWGDGGGRSSNGHDPTAVAATSEILSEHRERTARGYAKLREVERLLAAGLRQLYAADAELSGAIDRLDAFAAA